MSFGLANVGATFQKAMDMAFGNLMYKIVLVYLDDITVFSKEAKDHIFHLRQVLERCREFGISLNPKKSVFAVHEGKLLGYIVSKHGTTIDPERVQAILELPLPSHKKGLQSFLGRINFVRRFIPDIANLLKPLTTMLKKNTIFSWTKEGKRCFEAIKEALFAAPALVNLDFTKDFILYVYGSFDTISAMLVQRMLKDSSNLLRFSAKVCKIMNKGTTL